MSKSKKTNTTQNSSTTNTLDPTYSSAVYGNYGRAQQAAATMTPFSGQRVAGFNSNQQAAQQGLFDLSSQHVGSGLLSQAATTASNAAAYKPATVTAARYQPATAQASLANAASVDRGSVQNVTSGAIGADAINNYLNPYTDQVLSTTLADLNRQKQIEQLTNASAATKAHAFGGTGAAVLQSLTNDNYTRQMASTAASLRQQGYNTALSAAQADAARRLQADQGNQSADLSVATTNAGLLNSTNLANAGARQQADQFNAGNWNEAERFAAGQDFSAQQSNQQAGLSANQQSLAAAGLLGQISDQQRNQAIGDVGLLGQVGDAQQAQSQKELTAALQAWQDGQALTINQQQMLNQALALVPQTGTTTADGKSSSVEKTPVNVLGAIGTVAGVLSGFGWAPLAAAAAKAATN